MDTQAWCWCGCPFAAHSQHVGGSHKDFCEDHGIHTMEPDIAGWEAQQDVIREER